jgi:hypothetical protein
LKFLHPFDTFQPEVFPVQLRIPLVLASLAFATVAFAQNPISSDAPFQVRYASNLNVGDSVINITNTGATATGATSSNLCVNVYAFSPDEQLVSCCSCTVTPNALVSLSAKNDLISNTLTPAVPTSIVVKLVATSGGSCNAATAGSGTSALATGLAAWGTTLHATPTAGAYAVTETAFTPATLSGAELGRITALCGFIQSNGSGFGICRSCRFGGLGAVAQ